MNENRLNDSDILKDLDDGNFETVWEGYDAARGQMLEELLRQEGFIARLIGTRIAALIGLGQFSAALRVEVPAEAAAEARAVVQEFLRNVAEDESDDTALEPDENS